MHQPKQRLSLPVSAPMTRVVKSSRLTIPRALKRTSSEGGIDEYYFEGDVSDVRVSSQGLIAASVFDRDTRAGKVQFLEYSKNLGFKSLGSVEVGYQPDQLSFAQNGKKLVAANEGEPLMFYGSDEIDQNPKGSVSIIEISKRPAKSRVNTLYSLSRISTMRKMAFV